MDLDRWYRIDALLDAALDLSTEERAGFLGTACDGDTALRSEVEALLSADRQSHGILDATPHLGNGDAAKATPCELKPTSTAGPYQLEREIGRGGMGVVYLASRADDVYERRVAVKILHGGRISPALERRFRRERQILANLEHPAIARLYEGGTTVDGRPYLVMESVEGSPIDTYCDQRRLTIPERLQLFRKVAAAVHYAHQNLVVHRDIKPSNILVTDEGEPKLLDFGIAKPLDPRSFPVTEEATATGLRPMTLSYASPEQARGEMITTATDVYSLGVLLYELTTGRLPHRFEGLSTGEAERVLSEEAPPRPSEVVATDEDSAAEVGHARSTRPQQLRRQLLGDLDNIVLMALRKEPARRYGSALQLSEDLRRHRDGLPVMARQESFRYQAGKFLRRHKLPVAAAALLALLVTGFAAAMAYQTTQIAHQRDLAELQRERAERVSDFLVDLFEGADPWNIGAEKITARQMLDRGRARIRGDLQDPPEIRANLLAVLGGVYGHLGLFTEAVPLAEEALEIRIGHLGSEHADVATSLKRIAWLDRQQGRFEEAEARYRQVLAQQERTLPADDLAIAKTLRSLAAIERVRGEVVRAEVTGRRALAITRGALGPDHPDAGGALRVTAGACIAQGKIDDAQQMLEEALRIDHLAYGERHVATASDLNNLAHIQFMRGDLAAASGLLERSLATWESIYPEGHPNFADALVISGVIAKLENRFDDAEVHLQHALTLYETTLGPEHPSSANSRFELADTLARAGRFAAAEPLFESALAAREKAYGRVHPAVAESLRGLAEMRTSQGRSAEAERLHRRALGIWKQYPDHSMTRGITEAFAAFLETQGRSSEAAEITAQATASPSSVES